MKFTISTFFGGLVALSTAAPAPGSYVVHEKRGVQLNKWSKRDIKLNRDAIIPVSIGLTQSSLSNAHDFLMDVSHPDSKNYGNHWSMEKIAKTFSPAAETIDLVKTWLFENGIDGSRIKPSRSQGWIKFDATIQETETLLRTDFYIYTNSKTGDNHLACNDYSVPTHLAEHIDFITPTVQFDNIVKISKKRRSLPERKSKGKPPTPQIQPSPGDFDVDAAQTTFNLTNCDDYITPECLRALYGFPKGTKNISSYGIVEYTPQAFLQSDLDIFYSRLAADIPTGTAPIYESIDGGVDQTDIEDFDYNGESDLDLEYSIAIVHPQTVTLYQVGDEVEEGSFNNFLDALDASYCTSDGGDNDEYDSEYPDPYGGYQSQDCGTLKPAKVISASYTYNEADLPASYMQRQCLEYLKLGLAGTTILYSSGDYGVAGNEGDCCAEPACAGGDYNYQTGAFNPSFPGTCPYITSVGATQIKPNTSVTATSPEEAAETIVYSGGGFSNVFPIPIYQIAAVESYLLLHKPSYTAAKYNNSGLVRGYPDVSANGANYVVAIDGALSLVYGTSCASPVFGAIITLINEERAAIGKGSVGFLNPVIYTVPWAFNDITSGGNQGCGTAGFTAASGWDPVTGLGTPNYPKLLDIFKLLP